MHDRLLDTLLGLAEVRLVASLRDERLGFSDTKDLRIFVPDIHLISEKCRKKNKYVYATNRTDLLTEVAETLKKLKLGAGEDETVTVYQLGDFLDLWREAPGFDATLDAAAQIKDDHEDLVTALMDRKLKARFLLGNHDLDLYRWPDYTAWERRYYLPDSSLGAPSAIVLHGDIFDWIEKFPDLVQNVFVYVFAPHLSPNDYALGEMKRFVERRHGKRTYQTFIQAQRPSTVGSLTQLGADAVPQNWNIQKEGSAPERNLDFLDAASQACAKANHDYGTGLKVAIIGHTHHARIATRETPEGDLFTLVDCGAWIENCVGDGDASPAPNAQLAALCANEVRVYQLSPR